jgi:effector-binding domain-containing protein
MTEQIMYAGVNLEEFTDRVAEKVFQKMNRNNDTQTPPSASTEDILFKSIKEAAAYYGCCYQTLSKEMSRITHIPIGRTIKVYKSEIEKAIQKYGILSKKKGKPCAH